MKSIALIGYGNWGKKLYKTIIDNSMFKVKHILKSSDSLSLANNRGVDAVIIATPPETHIDIATKIIDKPIFIEKPLATKSEDLKRIKDYSKIFIGNKYKYSPILKKLNERLEREEIKFISGSWTKKLDYVPECGIFLDLGWHYLYLINWFVGENYKKITKTKGYIKDGIITSGSIKLDYEDFSAVLDLSYNNDHHYFQNRIRIETDKNTYIIDENEGILRVTNKSSTESEDSNLCVLNELRVFENIVDTGTKIIKQDHNFKMVRDLED